jgi:Tol biopolymer transport system component
LLAGVSLFFALRSGDEPKPPPAFRTLNFRRETIFRAFFAPDGRTVLYSAAAEGTTPEIFTVRPEYPEPQSLGLQGVHLLGVSSKGELAVLTKAKFVMHRFFIGTLARMPMGGGAPREILEDVREAAWSPDGTQLAIIRKVGGKDRLEYPIGKVLCESAGYLSDLRVSPDGKHIAYFEHPWEWDDRGSINIVDLQGKVTVLADGYWGEEGIAWSPDGHEILYSAGFGGADWPVFAVTPGGKKRIAQQAPGGLIINDVAPDGRLLVTRDDMTNHLIVHDAATSEDRDISWLSMSMDGFLSPDGQTVVFDEQALETNYATCLRKIDGSPVARLGEGRPHGISPDGKSILAGIPSTPPQLVIYPIGPGEPRHLERGNMQSYAVGRWFRDNKRVVFSGNEPGKGSRLYVQDISGGPPKAVTPEGYQEGFVSSDGEFILSRGSDGKYVVLPIAGGEPRPTPLARPDFVVHWCADGRSVLSFREGDIPCRIERVDLETGKRELFREISPADRTGLISLLPTFVTDDQPSYVYSVSRTLSSLFVSESKP